MNNIKLGYKQGGFVKGHTVAYMYWCSKTIFFRAQFDRLLLGYWFHQPLERFVSAIVHESVHIVLEEKVSHLACRQLDNVLGEIQKW